MEHYKHFHRIILMVVLQGWFPGSYSQNWAIALPKSIRALRGSCVEIPCSFIHSRDLDYFNLIWYKKSLPADEIIFDQYFSSQIHERYRRRTSLVGNEPNSCSLRINDVQETGTYYPYIHGNCDDITDCQTVKVFLSDVPNKPSIQIPSSLKEEESATISCSVEHTCPSSPPTLRWNKDGYKLTARQEKLKDGVWKVDTIMAYLPSYQDHGTTLECEATYPNGLKSQQVTTLNIKFSPKNIRVVMFEGKKEVKESDEIRLICTSDANPAANDFIWYNNKRNETEELREKHGQNIINVTVGWDRQKFSCTARNPLGEGKSGVLELQFLSVPTKMGLPMWIIIGTVAGAILVILLILGLYLFLRKSKKRESSEGKRVETDYQNFQIPESPYTALQMRDTSLYEVIKNSQSTESPYAALQKRDAAEYHEIKLKPMKKI